MVKPIDPENISKDDLLNILISQAKLVAVERAETTAAFTKLDKSKGIPLIPVGTAHTSDAEENISQIDVNTRHKPGLLPAGPGSGGAPPSFMDDRIIEIKPKWRMTNRLQNTHTPKPK